MFSWRHIPEGCVVFILYIKPQLKNVRTKTQEVNMIRRVRLQAHVTLVHTAARIQTLKWITRITGMVKKLIVTQLLTHLLPLWNLQIYYCAHKSTTTGYFYWSSWLQSVPSQTCRKINFNIIFPSATQSLQLKLRIHFPFHSRLTHVHDLILCFS